MNARFLTHLPQRMALTWRTLNPLLAVAGVLLLLGLWVWCRVLPQMQDRLTQAHDDLAWEIQFQQRRQAARPVEQPVSSPASGADSLRNVLGEPRSVVRDLQRVHDLAASAGLALPQGEYRQSCEADIQVCKFRMQFSVVGPYDRLRAWTQAVLQALPHAAVDTLVLQRENVSDDEVSATLGFTLYVKARPGTIQASLPRSTP